VLEAKGLQHAALFAHARSSAKKLTLNQTPVITVTGRAFARLNPSQAATPHEKLLTSSRGASLQIQPREAKPFPRFGIARQCCNVRTDFRCAVILSPVVWRAKRNQQRNQLREVSLPLTSRCDSRYDEAGNLIETHEDTKDLLRESFANVPVRPGSYHVLHK
jgi:hypothetical protein